MSFIVVWQFIDWSISSNHTKNAQVYQKSVWRRLKQGVKIKILHKFNFDHHIDEINIEKYGRLGLYQKWCEK